MSNLWRRPTATGWRDTALFLTALGLLIHELVIYTGPERPTVLILLAGLLGAPAFLRADEKRNNGSPTTPAADQEPVQ